MRKHKKIFILSILIVLVVFVFILITNRSDYKKQVGSFNKVKAQDIEQLIDSDENIILYIGRETCPACRDFVPILYDYSNNNDINVYYLDSTETDEDKELKKFRDDNNIMYVPSLMICVNKKITFPKIPENVEDLDRILKATGFIE